jgi:hypothetical protein
MSKIKDELLRQQDTQMEYYGKFMDHIYEVLNPEPRLSESDIDQMEQDYGNSHEVLSSTNIESVPTVPSNTTETTRRSA